MLGRAIAASGLLIGLANAGNCPSSNPYAFAGSGVAGSVCCSVATTGSVSGVGTCGAMGGQGWMSYASTCCSGAQTPCNSMGDDPAVPCEHNADSERIPTPPTPSRALNCGSLALTPLCICARQS